MKELDLSEGHSSGIPTIQEELEKNGFIFKRHGASHDLYFQPNTKQTIPVKRHDFNEDDMRYIFKEANIEGGK